MPTRARRPILSGVQSVARRGLFEHIILTYHNFASTRMPIVTRGQSNLTKSASRGPIPRLVVTQGVEICTIEFLG